MDINSKSNVNAAITKLLKDKDFNFEAAKTIAVFGDKLPVSKRNTLVFNRNKTFDVSLGNKEEGIGFFRLYKDERGFLHISDSRISVGPGISKAKIYEQRLSEYYLGYRKETLEPFVFGHLKATQVSLVKDKIPVKDYLLTIASKVGVFLQNLVRSDRQVDAKDSAFTFKYERRVIWKENR